MGIKTIEYIDSRNGGNAVESSDLCSGPDRTIVVDRAGNGVGAGNITNIDNSVVDNSISVKGDGNKVNSDNNGNYNYIGIILTIIGIILAW